MGRIAFAMCFCHHGNTCYGTVCLRQLLLFNHVLNLFTCRSAPPSAVALGNIYCSFDLTETYLFYGYATRLSLRYLVRDAL